MNFTYSDVVTYHIIDIVPKSRLFALKNNFYRYPLYENSVYEYVRILSCFNQKSIS